MIRARLLRAWPNLSHYFGIHPWDVERLTVFELNAYLDAIKQIVDAHAKAKRERRSGRRR